MYASIEAAMMFVEVASPGVAAARRAARAAPDGGAIATVTRPSASGPLARRAWTS